jgi:hypothetical protein
MAAANPALERSRAVPRVSLAYKWQVLIVLLPGVTLFTIDVTVVNVALTDSARSTA